MSVHLLIDLGFIIVFAAAQYAVTVFLLRRIDRNLIGAPRPLAKAGLILFDVLLAVSYPAFSGDLAAFFGLPIHPAQVLGFAAFSYLLLTTGCVLVRLGMLCFRKRSRTPIDYHRRRLLTAAGNAVIAAPFIVYGYAALIERKRFRVREVDITLPNLPADLAGLRLLHLSDIHLGAFLSPGELALVIEIANTLRAHLAIITGDLISWRGDPLEPCICGISRLRVDAGIFACMGNHERYAGVEQEAQTIAARQGIRFLRGESTQLRFGASTLNIAGVDYEPISHRPRYLRNAEQLVVPHAANILLSHNPDVFPVAARQGYDLTLAGHTHGGQVNIELLNRSINPAAFITPFVYGLYRSDHKAAYVTSGIGTVGIPARLGMPPEISLLKLDRSR